MRLNPWQTTPEQPEELQSLLDTCERAERGCSSNAVSAEPGGCTASPSQRHSRETRAPAELTETRRHRRLQQVPSPVWFPYCIQITGLESTLQISCGKSDAEKCTAFVPSSIPQSEGRFSSTRMGRSTQMQSMSTAAKQQQFSKPKTDETLRENTFSNTLLNHPQPKSLFSVS